MLIPAGIAILIGTAFIAATFLFSNSMDDSLRRQRTAQLGEANYIATMKTNSNDAVSENGSADRTTVADFNLDRIRATKGVKGAASTRPSAFRSPQRASARTDTPSARQPTASCCRSASLRRPAGRQQRGGVAKIRRQTTWSGCRRQGGRRSDIQRQRSERHAVRDVRVVGLTSDPFGVYSFYGGASVLSENVVAAVYGVDDFDHMQAYTLLLDIDDADAAAAQRTVDEVSGSCRNPMAWNRADRSRRRPSGTSARTTPASPPYSC